MGLRPVRTTSIMASLSTQWMTVGVAFLAPAFRASKIPARGKPFVLNARLAATSSASVVDWLIQPCPLLWPDNGKYVFLPNRQVWIPLVDRLVRSQPAKSESE